MHTDWVKSKGGSEGHIITANYDGELTLQEKDATLTTLYRLFRSPLDCVNKICDAHSCPLPFIHTSNRVNRVKSIHNILYDNNICRFNFVLLVWIFFKEDEFKSITGFKKPSSNIREMTFLELFTEILTTIDVGDASEQLKQLCSNNDSEIKVEALSEKEKILIRSLNRNYAVLEARGRLIFLLALLGCSIEAENNQGSFIFIQCIHSVNIYYYRYYYGCNITK